MCGEAGRDACRGPPKFLLFGLVRFGSWGVFEVAQDAYRGSADSVFGFPGWFLVHLLLFWNVLCIHVSYRSCVSGWPDMA